MASHDLWTGYYDKHARSSLRHTIDSLNPTPNHGNACGVGRAGYSTFMCLWYGGHEAFVSHMLRLPKNDPLRAECAEVAARSIEHAAEQIWFAMFDPKENSSGPRERPPGEYVIKHGPGFIGRDSDIFRHCGIYGMCVLMLLPEVKAKMKSWGDALQAMLLYGYWLTGYDPHQLDVDPDGSLVSRPTTPGQGYGTALQNRSLVGLYQLTGDVAWLRFAHIHMEKHFRNAHKRETTKGWPTWDTGRKGRPLGGDAQGLGGTGLLRHYKAPKEADLINWLWYDAEWTVSFHRFGRACLGAPLHPDEKALYVQFAATRALQFGKWVSLRDRPNAPLGDLTADGSQDFHNSHIQGLVPASEPDVWARPGKCLSAPQWLDLWNADVPYRIPTGLVYKCAADGRYWQGYWDDIEGEPANQIRYHHQYSVIEEGKPPAGPHSNNLSNDGSRAGDAAAIYAELTRNEEDELGADCLIMNSLAFQGINGGRLIGRRSERAGEASTTSKNSRAVTWRNSIGIVRAESKVGGKLEEVKA